MNARTLLDSTQLYFLGVGQAADCGCRPWSDPNHAGVGAAKYSVATGCVSTHSV
jgi:hypothetical protein